MDLIYSINDRFELVVISIDLYDMTCRIIIESGTYTVGNGSLNDISTLNPKGYSFIGYL